MRPGTASAAAAAAVAAVVLLAAGTLPGAEDAAPRVALRIDEDALGASAGLKAWTGKRPSLADADGDGDLDIVAQNQNRRVYVIDAQSGRALVEVEPWYPYGPDLGPFNGPKAADLDGDGRVELVNVNRAAVASVWALVPDGDGLRADLQWERHLEDHHAAPSADAGPVLGDLDSDGDLEVVVQTEETGFFVLHHDGSVHWSLAEYGGNAEPVVRDVDGDGDLDAVFFTDAGRVIAVDGPTGEVLWRFEGKAHGVWPGSAASAGIVDDLDGDGRVEVAFCARNVENATPDYAPGAPYYRQHHFVLFALRDGELLWKAKPSWGNPLCSAYLMAHDADGDGTKEIFGMDWNTVGHKPGNWERTGNPHAFAFGVDGRELWHATLDAWNAKPHVALGDWDGDGDQDVVAYGDGDLVVLDALTGTRIASFRLGSHDVKQGPLLADLDADGDLDAVVAVEGSAHAFFIIDTGAAYSPPAWPGWEAPVRAPPRPPAPTSPTPSSPAPTPDDDDPPPASPSAPEISPSAPSSEPGETAGIPGPHAAFAAAALAAATLAAPRGRRR